MTYATKRRAIIFLILAALITVLLAAALPQLELQKGVPLPARNNQTKDTVYEVLEPSLLINRSTFIGTAIGLFLLMVFIYLVVYRRKLPNWREMTQVLVVVAILSLFATVLLYFFSGVEISMVPSAAEILPPEIAVVGPPLAPVPGSLLWLVWIGLAGLSLLLVFGVVRLRIQQKAARDPLALEAEQAVDALKAGQDLSNVIIRCYEQMSLILKKEEGLTLEKTMTAREFEALLEMRGVPHPPVRQLTRLFEFARYAAQAPGPAEEAQAIDCLNAIAHYRNYSGEKEPNQAK